MLLPLLLWKAHNMLLAWRLHHPFHIEYFLLAF
jgi:hypothetical protein